MVKACVGTKWSSNIFGGTSTGNLNKRQLDQSNPGLNPGNMFPMRM